jgi:hypothetical protein
MTDYGQELEFGYFLIPDAGDPHGSARAAGRDPSSIRRRGCNRPMTHAGGRWTHDR